MEKNTTIKCPHIHTATCTNSSVTAAEYIRFWQTTQVFKVQLLSKSEKVTVTLELWSWLICIRSCIISSSCSSTLRCNPWMTWGDKNTWVVLINTFSARGAWIKTWNYKKNTQKYTYSNLKLHLDYSGLCKNSHKIYKFTKMLKIELVYFPQTTMSLLPKSSLSKSCLAVGRTLGFLLISIMMFLAKTGHLWQNGSGIFPSFRSPRVRTRSISVPKGWNNSKASTPMLYMSDCKKTLKLFFSSFFFNFCYKRADTI